MKDYILELIIASVIGAIIMASVIGSSNDLVSVHGKTDAFQTVEWKGKNYRLVPLDQVSKP